MPKLALAFTEIPTPDYIRRDHTLRGGAGLWRYVANVRDGVLRVMVGKEPAGPKEEIITHVSASVGTSERLISPPFRRPTNEEMAAIKEGLFSLLKFNEENSGADPCCRHLWEVPNA